MEQFVKQDAVKIFEKNPSWVGKFAQTVTDVAGRVNRLVEGEGRGFSINLPETTKKYIRSTQTGAGTRWVQALKQWNGSKTGKWCIPKKGTKEYDEVKKLMKKIQ